MFVDVVFPHLVPAFTSKVMDIVKKYDRMKMLEHPIICGYILEKEFLQHEKLCCIDVSVVNASSDHGNHFSFEIEPAPKQESGSVTSTLIDNKVYHLHERHPAIDGVCVAQEKTTKQRYLLLMQVSLSTYENHNSKGIDITKSVTWPESAFKNTSVAKYYANLCDVEEDHVIYLYISPRKLDADRSVFTQECDGAETGLNKVSNKYWYGFVKADSDAATLIKTIALTLGLSESV